VGVEPRVEPRRIELDEETLQQRILSLGASWQTAQYALIKHVAQLDAIEGRTGQGLSTCAQWVARALDIEVSTARELIRVGRALEECPRSTPRSMPASPTRRSAPSRGLPRGTTSASCSGSRGRRRPAGWVACSRVG